MKIVRVSDYVDRLHEKYPLIPKKELLSICIKFLRLFHYYLVRDIHPCYYTLNHDFYFFISHYFVNKMGYVKKYVNNNIKDWIKLNNIIKNFK